MDSSTVSLTNKIFSLACQAICNSASFQQVNAVIWCTGFKATLDHLKPLGIVEENNTILVEGSRSVKQSNLWLVGYGEWTGPGSATLVGVSRTARATVDEIAAYLDNPNPA